MKKYIIVLVSALVLASGWAFAQNGGYVRKTKEPEFFVPEKDGFNKPEKLPPVIVKKEKNSVQETPEYQQKYEEYQQDIQKVGSGGEIAENEGLTQALTQMDSGAVFEVKKTPSQNSAAKENFERVLDETLEQN